MLSNCVNNQQSSLKQNGLPYKFQYSGLNLYLHRSQLFILSREKKIIEFFKQGLNFKGVEIT